MNPQQPETGKIIVLEKRIDIWYELLICFDPASSRNSESNTLSSDNYVVPDIAKVESYLAENIETIAYNYKKDPNNPLVPYELYTIPLIYDNTK